MRMEWKSGERATLSVAGAKLEARVIGPAPWLAPTIVLLHEGLGCAALWRDFPERLVEATGCGVFAYSRAGYGGSDPVPLPRPLDYLSREAIDTLPLILEAIGFEQGFLLGHSDGASIAALYLGNVEDERIMGGILMAPHFFTEPGPLLEVAETRKLYESGDLRQRLAKYHSHVDIAFYGWNDAWLDPKFRDWNITDALERIHLPVLAMQGRDDRYGTLKQIEIMSERLAGPYEKLVLEGCGHAPFLEKSSETLSAVREFITRQRQRKRGGTGSA